MQLKKEEPTFIYQNDTHILKIIITHWTGGTCLRLQFKETHKYEKITEFWVYDNNPNGSFELPNCYFELAAIQTRQVTGDYAQYLVENIIECLFQKYSQLKKEFQKYFPEYTFME